MSKELFYNNEARRILINGIKKLNDMIKVTLGPKGRNVVISNIYGKPFITNDGATIAVHLESSDPRENVGIELVKEVALKTNELAGDGTTTATILAETLVSLGIDKVNNGLNPIVLKETLEKLVFEVIKYLEQIKINVDNLSFVENIAKISSGNNSIGKIISEAYDKVGFDGLILVEDNKSQTTKLEILKGYKFDGIIANNYFLTDISKQISEVKNPYFLITNKKINSINEIINLLEKLIEKNINIVIICDSISDEVMNSLILNKMKNILNVSVITIEDSVLKRDDILDDIAVLTGTIFYKKEITTDYNNIEVEDLGTAEKIIANSYYSTIINGYGEDLKINNRKKDLKIQIESCDTDFQKEALQKRIARLNEIIAIIKIGALSELESTERKMKIEDALNATKASIREGILPGGGIALLKSIKVLEKYKSSNNIYEKECFELLENTLKKPFLQLEYNSGINDENLINVILKSDTYIGYDFLTDKTVNMIDNGIIDPFEVEKSALLSAFSIASLILTTEGIILDTDKSIKKSINEEIINNSVDGII